MLGCRYHTASMRKLAVPSVKRKTPQPVINEPFVMIPVRALKLPSSALRVLGHLMHRQNKHGYCWPSYPDIRRETGISDRSAISNALKRLVEENWIEKKRRGNNSTVYKITLDKSLETILHKSLETIPEQSGNPDANNNHSSLLTPNDDERSVVLSQFLRILELIPFATDGISPPSNHLDIPLDGELIGRAKKIVASSRNTDDLLRLAGVIAHCYGLENDPFHIVGATYTSRKMSLSGLLKDFSNQLRLARAWSLKNQLPENAIRHEFRK